MVAQESNGEIQPELSPASADSAHVTKPRNLRRTLVASAVVGVLGATALIVPGLTSKASAANTTITPVTADMLADRGNAVDRSITRPAPQSSEEVATLAEQRAENLARLGEQVSEQQRQLAVESRLNGLTTQSAAIQAEVKRIVEDGKFYWPTEGGITSWWGPRMHPILHYVRMHGGVDIGGACNQPIWAVRDGVVSDLSSGSQSGNTVRLDHGTVKGAKLETSYLHMSSFAVSAGQQVKRGQVIGYVGNTGLSTACHLHFTTYVNGVNSDPVPFLTPGQKSQSNFSR